jgi:hypothetical protein
MTELYLYDTIGAFGISANAFIEQVQAVPADSVITVAINSDGGSVTDGNAIIAALQRHPAGYTARVDGLAASMAAVIAFTAPSCVASDGAMFMVHNVQGAASGDADEIRAYADIIQKFNDSIVGRIAAKTGKSVEEIAAMLDEETWLTAQEALDMGLIASITAPLAAAAQLKEFPIVAKAQLGNIVSELKSLREIVAVKENEILALRSSATELTSKYEAESAKTSAAQSEVNKWKELHAQLKASLGIAPAAVVPPIAAAAKSPTEIAAHLQTITDPVMRAQYFRDHRDALLAANNAERARK